MTRMLGKQISNELLKKLEKQEIFCSWWLSNIYASHYTTIEANDIIRNEAPPEEGTGDDSATEDTQGYLF